jgi:hypothetical protein
MKKIETMVICLSAFCLALALAIPATWAAEEYKLTFDQWSKAKAFYDDPRPVLKDLSMDKIIPPEDYAKLTFDKEAMKKAWEEVVGFKSPDVVGKIAPEIKPGKYTYQDKEKYPGFKELLVPEMYDRFNPGGPPRSGNMPEIEIVPTKQYYYALPIAEATKKYAPAVKLDDQGYINYDTYEAGFPFPRPSGPHKAIQALYNWEKRYMGGDGYWLVQYIHGYDRNLKLDFDAASDCWWIKLRGRCTMPPFGWYDERAKQRGETRAFNYHQLAPRDSYGNVINNTNFEGLNDYDQFLIYIAQLRRVRKLSGTDTQDQAVGQDVIYEDYEGFSQKLTPTRFPYKYEVIAEREYLFPNFSEDWSEWISSKGKEIRGVRFERRPCYVIQMTQLDKNYVYGRRVIFLDAETFLYHLILNYDQKGRLYRVMWTHYSFYPDMGNFTLMYFNGADFIDLHSQISPAFQQPAPWMAREHTGMQYIIKKGK